MERPIRDWFREVCARPRIHILPITPEIAAVSGELSLHGDPADRLIVATAMVHGISLISADEKIRMVKLVTTIW